MVSSSHNFQPYLQSVCHKYAEWWTLYTLTDVQSKIKKGMQETQVSLFDVGLMAEREIRNSTRKSKDNAEAHKEFESLPVLQALRDYRNKHVLLVGRPGSGKSTTLARLLLDLAKESIDNPDAPIPVLIELRYSGSVTELIRDFFRQHKLDVNLNQVEELLFEQRLWLLIDGVNELAENISALEQFRRTYRELSMVFTTRKIEFDSTLGIETKLEMQLLTPEQIQKFVKAYLPSQKAKVFLQKLRKNLLELGQIPFILWRLCFVFERDPNQQLPSNLAETLQAAQRAYEKESVRNHEVPVYKGDVKPSSDRQLWFPALKHLALVMMEGKTSVYFQSFIARNEAEREISKLFHGEPYPNQIARNCLNDLLRYHLLQTNDRDQIEFQHPLIQEYYAAEALLALLQEKDSNLVDDGLFKRKYLNALKWTEVISLMLALLEDEEQAKRIVKLALDVDLMLGAKLAGELKLSLQKKVVRFLADTIKNSLEQSQTEKKVSKILMIYLLSLTRSKYVIENLRVYYNQNLQDSQILATLASVLDKFGEPGFYLLAGMLTHFNSEVRQRVAISLGNIYIKKSVEKLYKLIKDPVLDVRISTILSLGRLLAGLDDIDDKEAISKLTELLIDSEPAVIRCTVIAIGRIRSDIAIAQLTKSLRSENYYISLCSAKALAHVRSEESINQLIEALKNEKSYIRQNAVRGLVNAGSSKIVPHLLNAIPYLVQLLNYENNVDTRKYAIIALGNIGSSDAVYDLIKILKDTKENLDIRIKVVEALGRIGSDIIVEDLIQILQTENSEELLKKKVIKALEEISIDSLINILKNGQLSSKIQIMIAHALSQKLSASEISCLIQDIEFQENINSTVLDIFNTLDKSRKIDSYYDSLEKILNDFIQAGSIEEKIAKLPAISNCAPSPELLKFLPNLKIEWLKTGEKSFKKTIITIQNKCKFYNYNDPIITSSQDSVVQHNDLGNYATLNIRNVEKLIMSDKPSKITFNQENATIGVNYAAEGSKQEFTQNLNDKEQNFEVLLADYKHFINELGQRHKEVRTDEAAIQVIEVEFQEIKRTQPLRWQNFLKLKRLWNGGKKTLVKTGEHFTEQNFWGKIGFAFLEGVMEDSE